MLISRVFGSYNISSEAVVRTTGVKGKGVCRISHEKRRRAARRDLKKRPLQRSRSNKKKRNLRIKRYNHHFHGDARSRLHFKKEQQVGRTFRAEKRERESACLADRRKEEMRLERREIDII